jgi:hypothetical protein
VSGERAELFPSPGKKLVYAMSRMTSQTSEDIGQPGMGVDVVQPAGHDETIDGGGSLTAAIGSCKHP